MTAYLDFPKFASWMVTGFNREFTAGDHRIKAGLMAEGTASQAFGIWPRQTHANDSPIELTKLQGDAAKMAELRQVWIADTVAQGIAAAKQSPAYLDAFCAYYEDRQKSSPSSLQGYTFDQFIALQKARAQGKDAFAIALRPGCIS